MDRLGRYRIARHATLGSTNDVAMSALRAGDPGGLFVVADRQTDGRGRQGRQWQSPPSNLHATLALRDPCPQRIAPELGFVAGVALVVALRGLLNFDPGLRLKWPNDVLHQGAKVAGLLLESAALPSGDLACVVGFGVNCVAHPEGLAYPATDLSRAADAPIEADTVLAALAESIATHLSIWARGDGFSRIRALWLDFAAGLGETISVATPRGTLRGIFADLDATGRLIVETDAGRVAVEAGDVFLPGQAIGGAMNTCKADDK